MTRDHLGRAAPRTPLAERRHPSLALHMSGLALLFIAAGMTVSALVDVSMNGTAVGALLVSAALTAIVGGALRQLTSVPSQLPPRSVFGAVTVSWLAMSTAGALPYLLSGLLPTIDGALFESISGFTCTGSTVLDADGFASASPGVMWWRQLTQWFGGMGIIVLAVAVLPYLGVGGLELISAEAPGPKSDRLAPRVSETARRLWLVYAGFSVVTVAALLITGLSLYDATAHALAVVSTGGFSPNIDSIGTYDSVAVELVVVVGMIYGGASFTLHYHAFQGRIGDYWRSSELRAYLATIVGATIVVTLVLVGGGSSAAASARDALFNVVTLATSTGFGNAQGAGSAGDFVLWAPAAQVILFSLMWSGGMTGSTSGGIKILRVQVMGRMAWREVIRARRPRSVRPIKQGADAVDEQVVSRIAGFVLLYFVITVAATIVLSFLGTDLVTAFSGSVSAMGNMGPALGDAGPTSSFLEYPRAGRMLLALLMLVGRLEVFPMVLVVVVMARRGAARIAHRASVPVER